MTGFILDLNLIEMERRHLRLLESLSAKLNRVDTFELLLPFEHISMADVTGLLRNEAFGVPRKLWIRTVSHIPCFLK